MAYAQTDKKYGEQEAISEERGIPRGEKKTLPSSANARCKVAVDFLLDAGTTKYVVCANSIHLLQHRHLGNQAMVTFKRVLVLFVPRTEFVVYGAHW